MNLVLNRTVVVDSYWRFDNLCGSHRQSQSLWQRAFRDFRGFDSEDDYRTGCRNVSHCQQQQSYLGLRSPGWSTSTYFWNDSWVQTFHSGVLHPTRARQVKVPWDAGDLQFFVLIREEPFADVITRQHLKTLSVVPARVWTRDLPLSRQALSQLS